MRLGVVHEDAKDRARAEEILPADALQGVAERRAELVDEQLTAPSHGDDRPAGFDEFAQTLQAGLLDPAFIFRRNVVGRLSGQDLLRSHVGKDDDVEIAGRVGGAQVLGMDRLEGKLELLQNPARPAFVRVAAPRLIEGRARASDAHGFPRRDFGRGDRVDPQ